MMNGEHHHPNTRRYHTSVNLASTALKPPLIRRERWRRCQQVSYHHHLELPLFLLFFMFLPQFHVFAVIFSLFSSPSLHILLLLYLVAVFFRDTHTYMFVLRVWRWRESVDRENVFRGWNECAFVCACVSCRRFLARPRLGTRSHAQDDFPFESPSLYFFRSHSREHAHYSFRSSAILLSLDGVRVACCVAFFSSLSRVWKF